MSRADIDRWNRKYAAGNPNPEFLPDELLVQHRSLLTGGGLALDLACGVGHNALYLARRGYEVVALDGSLSGLRYCRAQLALTGEQVHLAVVDLDQFVPPRGRFALILVARFLSRPLLPRLKDALAPGGLMIYQTFNRNWLRAKPDFNPDYVLRPGELAEAFADFDCLATNDDPDLTDDQSYWIGRRPN